MESILSTNIKYRVRHTEDVKLGDEINGYWISEQLWHSDIDSYDKAINCYNKRCNTENYHDVILEKIEIKIVEEATILMRQGMVCKGETVFAIVKNYSTFLLDIIEATVSSVDDNEIVIERSRSSLITDVYTFPKSEWNKSIFYNHDEAQIGLRNIYKEQGYKE